MERINALLVGAPRQGKTYYGEKKLIEYAKEGGCSVVYNVGRQTDFSKFLQVEIVSVSDYKNLWEKTNMKKMPFYEIPKEVNFFKFKDKIYPLEIFSKMFAGKCIKIERVLSSGNIRSEDYFFSAIYKYFFNTMVMIDDCRTIFRKGLSSEMIGLLSRVNHAGKKFAPSPKMIGIDTVLTYHGFNTVNDETYQFINLLIQFRTMYLPKLRIENTELEEQIESNYNELKTQKQYSHFETDLLTGKNKLFLP